MILTGFRWRGHHSPGHDGLVMNERASRGRLSAALALSALAERREVAGGVAAYLGAGDDEDLGAVRRAHYLSAPGRNARAQQEPVEIDALIP